ncbi:MAG TPA: hypothetical protein VJ839_00275 [Candidatus Limnocylindria bacterium]|nr:hypothetical protein [Candidatus Limnocylindria bacterium]
MAHRVSTWAIVIWSGFMALGIFAAFLGIGGDCIGLTASAFSECQADAWVRGGIGLSLLMVLWLIVAGPMAIVWFASRPKSPS